MTKLWRLLTGKRLDPGWEEMLKRVGDAVTKESTDLTLAQQRLLTREEMEELVFKYLWPESRRLYPEMPEHMDIAEFKEKVWNFPGMVDKFYKTYRSFISTFAGDLLKKD